jgi:hypothetical protein
VEEEKKEHEEFWHSNKLSNSSKSLAVLVDLEAQNSYSPSSSSSFYTELRIEDDSEY